MMAQDDRVVVGLDVAKDKVDACIRPLSLRRTAPSTAAARAKRGAWLGKNKGAKGGLGVGGGRWLVGLASTRSPRRSWRRAEVTSGSGPRRYARPESRCGSSIQNGCA